MCLTGSEGSVEACDDTPARVHTLTHTHTEQSGEVAYFKDEGVCACMGLYSVRVSVCGFPVLQLQDQARTGSWMWVNCDLAISLPGGDKSSPCWCVNRSVITSSCHDCLRMRASGNLHCRSLTDTMGGKKTLSISFIRLSVSFEGVSQQMSRC